MSEIRQPKFGDVITPTGGIYCQGGRIVEDGMIQLGYLRGLLALRYGWRIENATDKFFIIRK